MTENLAERYDDLPKPGYEILDVTESDSNGIKRTLTHVKLSRTHFARKTGQPAYVEVDYVIVGAFSVDTEDEDGKFHYEETTILASDKDKELHDAIMLLVPTALPTEYALFSIGEV